MGELLVAHNQRGGEKVIAPKTGMLEAPVTQSTHSFHSTHSTILLHVSPSSSKELSMAHNNVLFIFNLL